MSNFNDEISRRVFTSLRKITQEMDKHSSNLKRDFTARFSALTDWEKMTKLSAFERVAVMMASTPGKLKRH